MAGIPEDVIAEILLRLPVEALLRFRCVSKRWRNLIDSPNFVKSQLDLPNKPQFVMMVVFFNKKSSIYYSELDSDYIENPSPNFKELTLPWRDEILSNVSDFVGHCNGLLCCFCRNKCTFLVFNPFIGKHIQVPPPEQQRCSWGTWGFGYDRDSDDYKVVALAYEGENAVDFRGVLWIYSLKSSSWRTIVNFPLISITGSGVFVDGALHWIAKYYRGDPSKFIFALNLGNLEYLSVPLPSDNSKKMSHLGVLDGCLYVIYSGYYDKTFCYLWVMKEYGLKESWTRLRRYDGHFIDRDLLFVMYGDSLVQCKFLSLWSKFNRCALGGKKLVYEPSLVCARSGT